MLEHDTVRAALAQAAGEGTAPGNPLPEVLPAISRLPAGSTLLLEDLQGADNATLDLLTFITRRMAARRVLLVLRCGDGEARGLLLRDAEGKLRFRHERARVATLEALPPLARVETGGWRS